MLNFSIKGDTFARSLVLCVGESKYPRDARCEEYSILLLDFPHTAWTTSPMVFDLSSSLSESPVTGHDFLCRSLFTLMPPVGKTHY